MSTRKTDQDIEWEDFADNLNHTRLMGTDLSVTAGGKNGPFTLSISRLDRDRLLQYIDWFLDDDEE